MFLITFGRNFAGRSQQIGVDVCISSGTSVFIYGVKSLRMVFPIAKEPLSWVRHESWKRWAVVPYMPKRGCGVWLLIEFLMR